MSRCLLHNSLHPTLRIRHLRAWGDTEARTVCHVRADPTTGMQYLNLALSLGQVRPMTTTVPAPARVLLDMWLLTVLTARPRLTVPLATIEHMSGHARLEQTSVGSMEALTRGLVLVACEVTRAEGDIMML